MLGIYLCLDRIYTKKRALFQFIISFKNKYTFFALPVSEKKILIRQLLKTSYMKLQTPYAYTAFMSQYLLQHVNWWLLFNIWLSHKSFNHQKNFSYPGMILNRAMHSLYKDSTRIYLYSETQWKSTWLESDYR